LIGESEAAIFRKLLGVCLNEHTGKGFSAKTGIACKGLIKAGVLHHFRDEHRLKFLRRLAKFFFTRRSIAGHAANALGGLLIDGERKACGVHGETPDRNNFKQT
jgi:hypothetical protein